MKFNRYAAVVLAAGFSSRMQRFKPVLMVGGKTIADHLIGTFLQNGVEVILVVGFHRDELRAGIQNRNIQIIENLDYTQGMFTSIQAGLRSVNSDCQGVFIAPVDIPLVRPFTVRRLLTVAEAQPDKVVYPVFNNSRGHPPLMPADVVRTISASPPDTNLRSILGAFNNIAVEVPVPDSNILFDIDSPADYELLLKRFQRYEVPSQEECDIIIKDISQMTPELVRHCRKVGEVAAAIGQVLVLTGSEVDLEAIQAAAVLHDIAKGQPQHDVAGATMLLEMGFAKVADMVKVHTDLPEGNQAVPLETKVVFLADKLVAGESLTSIEDRYESAIKRFGTSADIKASIIRRMGRALGVKKEIELLLGYPLEKLIV